MTDADLLATPPAPPLWRALAATVVQRATDRFSAGVLAAAAGVALAAALSLGGLLVLDRAAPTASRVELDLPRAPLPSDTGDPVPPKGPVVVHAAGAVVVPGIYRMAAGSRVADLITAAGGARPDADLDQLNLAARLGDGDRVYVPRRGEVVSGLAASATSGPLDLNTATAAQLEELPGIGPSTAEAIISWRKAHGRFRSIRELLEVRGIGEAKLAALKDKVRVS